MEHPKIIMDTYEFLRWIIPVLAGFPKDQRYLLGQRIEDKLLSILEDLIVARYSKEKIQPLKKVNLSLEQLRFLVRLCVDLRFMNIKRYEYCAKRIDEIGIQAGGWIRQQDGKSNTGKEL